MALRIVDLPELLGPMSRLMPGENSQRACSNERAFLKSTYLMGTCAPCHATRLTFAFGRASSRATRSIRPCGVGWQGRKARRTRSPPRHQGHQERRRHNRVTARRTPTAKVQRQDAKGRSRRCFQGSRRPWCAWCLGGEGVGAGRRGNGTADGDRRDQGTRDGKTPRCYLHSPRHDGRNGVGRISALVAARPVEVCYLNIPAAVDGKIGIREEVGG